MEILYGFELANMTLCVGMLSSYLCLLDCLELIKKQREIAVKSYLVLQTKH